METDFVKSYGNLQHELDNAKLTLDSLNDSIRRIVGRRQEPCRNDRNKLLYETKKLERQNVRLGDSLKQKRKNDARSVFNRLSVVIERSDEESNRPRLTSRIIRELPTRQEIVDAQGTDLESRARNKRMFGSLLGTLHKFCQEESRLKQKEEKKAKIEKKLEEQELRERETIKKKRELLFLDRKRKQLEIKSLEFKLSHLGDFKIWEAAMMNLRHSIKTKSKPHIYFRPHKFSRKTEKLLAESQACLEKNIETKRENLNKEIIEFDNNIKLFGIPAEKVQEEKSLPNDKSPSQRSMDTTANESETVLKKGNSKYKENNGRHISDSVVCSSIYVVNMSNVEHLNN